MWQIILGIVLFIGGIGCVGSSAGAFFAGILLGSLLVYLGLKTKGIIHKPQKREEKLPPSNEQRILREESFQGAGVHYYESSIKKLACANPDWRMTKAQITTSGKVGRKIFKYNYINKPVKLIFEPDNPHDPDAIIIIIAGEKVGYIKSSENERVRFILDNREIKSISAFIGGGEYKFLSEESEIIRGSFGFSVNVKIKYI